MIRAFGRLLPYIARVKRPFGIGIAAILAATALSLVSPWILKIVVDGLTQGVDRTRLGLDALAVLGLALADGAFRYVMRSQLIGASREIEYSLRNDFFAHLERLPPAYFQANRAGDLMSRATNDLGAVRMMVGPAIMYFLSTALGFVIAVAIMWWIDPRLTLWALLPLPFVTIGTRYFGRAIHERFERIQAQLADMSAVTQEALAGVRVVRAYGQEGVELARFRRANDEYVERNRGLIRLQASFYPTLTLFLGLSGLIVLWFGGRDVMNGRLTLGEFVAFSRYLVLLTWPLIAFGWVINLAQRGMASWERMLEVLDAPVGDATATSDQAALARDRVSAATAAPLAAGVTSASPAARVTSASPIEGRIEARHLTFSYPGAATPALADVSFALPAGRTLGIVGATGSGKSTVTALLARLFDPPSGTLFVDGRDVRDMPLTELRGAMGVVSQEPFLFSETVGANVLFGLDGEWGAGSTRQIAADAARLASLDADVAAFPYGYDTMVGERGITLSGGQKQRVAIARALVTDPRILILDDALSAVDTGTERSILQALGGFRRARTSIIVAHRVSAVRDADQILVLSHGRVVERGTHDALIEAGGAYADLYRRQLLEEEVAGA